MNTAAIEQMVADVTGNPDAHDDLLDLLAAVAGRNAMTPQADQLRAGAQFVIGYLEQVPYMLKVALTAARNVGLEDEMHQVVDMVQSYWEQDEDIIPDHLGVIGLLDDAYCSLTTLQTFSDHYQLQTGKHLFPDDLTAANRVMREIIGEPYVGDLDRFVSQAIRRIGRDAGRKSPGQRRQATSPGRQCQYLEPRPGRRNVRGPAQRPGPDRRPGRRPGLSRRSLALSSVRMRAG